MRGSGIGGVGVSEWEREVRPLAKSYGRPRELLWLLVFMREIVRTLAYIGDMELQRTIDETIAKHLEDSVPSGVVSRQTSSDSCHPGYTVPCIYRILVGWGRRIFSVSQVFPWQNENTFLNWSCKLSFIEMKACKCVILKPRYKYLLGCSLFFFPLKCFYFLLHHLGDWIDLWS